jgi:Ca2+-binding RTX toxin-like protein
VRDRSPPSLIPPLSAAHGTRTVGRRVRQPPATGEATGDGADSLAQVENVTGSELDDRIVGNLRPNVLLGSGGKDLIDGRGGADRVTAGAGNDECSPEEGPRPPLGGPGSDRLLARDGARDRVDGGPGRDTARVDSRRDQVKSVAVLLR